jgi:hypothetical protein
MLDRLESPIQSFVQDYIADPLQWSGVSLGQQIRGCCGMICIGWIGLLVANVALKEWTWMVVNVIVLAERLRVVIWGLSSIEKLQDAKTRWVWKLWLFILASELIGVILGIKDPHRFGWFFIEIGIILYFFLIRCKPKPPVGNLKGVMDSA